VKAILRPMVERWSALPSRSRQRLLLGFLAAVGLAARDLVLLASAASLLVLTEIMPAATKPRGAKPAA
jgi:hypothetical protein